MKNEEEKMIKFTDKNKKIKNIYIDKFMNNKRRRKKEKNENQNPPFNIEKPFIIIVVCCCLQHNF